MFGFFVVIVALVCFATDSFAACPSGYYKHISFPTTDGSSSQYRGHETPPEYDPYIFNSDHDLSIGEWKVTWDSIGTLKGIASCNSTAGDNNNKNWDNDSSNWLRSANTFTNSANGNYCWCKSTTWTLDGGSAVALSGAWVFFSNFGSSDNCAQSCATYCGFYVYLVASFRSAMSQALCVQCPDGGTSDGTGDIATCYIPSTTNFTDENGTYHFSDSCYYSE